MFTLVGTTTVCRVPGPRESAERSVLVLLVSVIRALLGRPLGGELWPSIVREQVHTGTRVASGPAPVRGV